MGFRGAAAVYTYMWCQLHPLWHLTRPNSDSDSDSAFAVNLAPATRSRAESRTGRAQEAPSLPRRALRPSPRPMVLVVVTTGK